MWPRFDTQSFKQPTNCIVGIVTAFCKLVPKTNRHIRNVYRKTLYYRQLLVYSNGVLNMKSGLSMVYTFDFCELGLLLNLFASLFHNNFLVYFFVYITPLPSNYIYAYNNRSTNVRIFFSLNYVILII